MVILSAAAVALLILGAGEKNDGKTEYRQASELFKAGDYESALLLFEEAYELSKKRPSAIRSLAQCERALTLYDRAIDHFKEYLAAAPKAEDREAIEQTIWLLETQRKMQEDIPKEQARAAERARSDPPPPKELPKVAEATPPVDPPAPVVRAETPEEPSGSVLSSPWFWIAIGVVVAAGAVATGVALSSSRDPKYDAGTTGVVLHL
jgi:tetratricopeptide (TPR) repeat protein